LASHLRAFPNGELSPGFFVAFGAQKLSSRFHEIFQLFPVVRVLGGNGRVDTGDVADLPDRFSS
jgi:hypothetical protein